MDAGGHLQATHPVFIVWKPEYNLGIPILDEQHRGIVSIINSLHYGLANKRSDRLLKPVVGMVAEYTRLHFEIEEAFLGQCGFPDAERHRGWHRELMRKVSLIGRESLWSRDPRAFMDFLKEWWIGHICGKDLAFRDYCRNAPPRVDGVDGLETAPHGARHGFGPGKTRTGAP